MNIEWLEVIRNQGNICEEAFIIKFFSCPQVILMEICPDKA